MSESRYTRIGWYIMRSLVRTGEVPSVNDISNEFQMSPKGAHWALQAWQDYRPILEKLIEIENNPDQEDNKLLREFLLKEDWL